MGSLLFLWAKAALDLHSDFDAYFLCLLVALEGPGYVRIAVYWWVNRRPR